MSKQFCENRVMTEYHTSKPYFMTGNDDTHLSCSHNATPCDEMWKKFELFVTPPNSPIRDSEMADEQAPQLVPVGTAASLSAPDCFEEMNAVELQNHMDLTDIIYADIDACDCKNDRKLKTDPMWNGVGHQASSALREAHNRTSSPMSSTPCHPNGCVDPRNIFPFPVGLPSSTKHKKMTSSPMKRRAPVDGAETPSDSEEEIDVVTVEKGHNTTPLKATKTVISPNIVATLVPHEDGKLALVTNAGTRNNLSTKGIVRTISQNGDVDRGRAKNKYHLFTTTSTSGQHTPRTVSIIKDQSKSPSQTINRRHTTTDESQNLMKMANPKLVMQRGSDSISPVSRCHKKRILSLEGVSFCATTKVRQNLATTKDADDLACEQGNVTMLEHSDGLLTTSKFNVASPKMTITPIEIKEETDVSCQMRIIQPGNKRKRKAEVVAKMLPPGSGSDTEQIRAAHNVLERQRREGLRTLFLTLRDNVPELQRQDKTPKVHILNKAKDYCVELRKTERNLLAEKARFAGQNKRLKEMLERARSSAHQIRGGESDFESDYEETPTVSPMSSLPSSLPPSPSVFPTTGGYYIARRVSQDNSTSSQEVVLRLEPSVTANSSSGKQKVSHLVSALKQTNCRAFITPITKSPELTNLRGSSTPPDALSDGFECLSEEETVVL